MQSSASEGTITGYEMLRGKGSNGGEELVSCHNTSQQGCTSPAYALNARILLRAYVSFLYSNRAVDVILLCAMYGTI